MFVAFCCFVGTIHFCTEHGTHEISMGMLCNKFLNERRMNVVERVLKMAEAVSNLYTAIRILSNLSWASCSDIHLQLLLLLSIVLFMYCNVYQSLDFELLYYISSYVMICYDKSSVNWPLYDSLKQSVFTWYDYSLRFTGCVYDVMYSIRETWLLILLCLQLQSSLSWLIPST
jgi:hypothetical protein